MNRPSFLQRWAVHCLHSSDHHRLTSRTKEQTHSALQHIIREGEVTASEGESDRYGEVV